MHDTGPVISLQSNRQGEEIPAAKLSTGAPGQFHRLDERVVRMWATRALMTNGLLLLGGLVGGTALWIYARMSPAIIIPAWLFLALLFVLETRFLPRKRYETTSYQIGEGFFEFRSGLLWKTSVMLPLSRVQHIDLLRDPWEQHYGLATLDLHTAGTSKASQKVPGLEVGMATRIREELIAAADLEWPEQEREAETE